MKIAFSTLQVIQGSGAPKRAVQHWITNGVLEAKEKSPGSGSSNTFEFREIEVAKLLVPLAARKIPVGELAVFASAFRKVIALKEVGFIAENPAMKKLAEDLIKGEGPALGAPSGSGTGMKTPSAVQREKQQELAKQTARNEDEDRLFWAYVAYGMSARMGFAAFWEVWFDDEGPKVFARLPGVKHHMREKGWDRIFIHGAPKGEFAAIVPLIGLGPEADS